MKAPGLLLAAVLAVPSYADLSAQLPLRPATTINTALKNRLHASVDKINNSTRDGVTRISCTLIVDGEAFGSLDIDGVDFQRYFQWEESGQIPVEIDFPRRTAFKPEDKIVFHTVAGDVSTRLGDKAKK